MGFNSAFKGLTLSDQAQFTLYMRGSLSDLM